MVKDNIGLSVSNLLDIFYRKSKRDSNISPVEEVIQAAQYINCPKAQVEMLLTLTTINENGKLVLSEHSNNIATSIKNISEKYQNESPNLESYILFVYQVYLNHQLKSSQDMDGIFYKKSIENYTAYVR